MQAKRPTNPYKPRADGHTYIRLTGGPLNGLWFRNYPPMQQSYSCFGALYELRPNEAIDCEFAEDRQVGFVFIGFEEGME